jgi:hypothetical protein
MNKDLKYMPIDDKAGTFMSKHCSPMSYGTPLEKKSCGSPNKKIDPKAISEAVEGAKKYKKYVKEQTAPYDKRNTKSGSLYGYLDKEAYERQQRVKGIQSYHRYHLGKQVQDQGGKSSKAEKAKKVFFGVNKENAVEGGYQTFRDSKKIEQIKKDLNIKH